MAFIGNTNITQSFTPAIDYFSGNGSSTAFTLSRPVASVAQVQVHIDNVAQNPSTAYTVSGNTITFTSAPLSGTNNIYVYYTSPITQVIQPSQGTVGTSQLNTTGTASSSTYLRGDMAWSTIDALPSQSGNSGKYLTTNGSTASWGSTTGSGNVVLATSPTLVTPTISGNVTGLTSASLPTGSVLQVVSTTKSDTWSASLPNWADITGMSLSITPSSASNKILVIVNLSFMVTDGAAHGYRLVRNSTPISIADAAGSRPLFSGMVQDGNINTSFILNSATTYLDSPATTSATTYKLQAFATYSAAMFYVNLSAADRNASQYDGRTVSSITAMEIKG